jgi:hypothetical protein
VKGYPRRFLPTLVATFVVVGISGLLLVPTMLDFRLGWDVPWRLPGAHRLWVAAIHSTFALLICGFAGALWSVHIRVGWRSRRHLITGLATAGFLAATSITALGVLYFGNERWLTLSSAGHTLLGAASLVGGGSHWIVAIAERARRVRSRGGRRVEPADTRAAAVRAYPSTQPDRDRSTDARIRV